MSFLSSKNIPTSAIAFAFHIVRQVPFVGRRARLILARRTGRARIKRLASRRARRAARRIYRKTSPLAKRQKRSAIVDDDGKYQQLKNIVHSITRYHDISAKDFLCALSGNTCAFLHSIKLLRRRIIQRRFLLSSAFCVDKVILRCYNVSNLTIKDGVVAINERLCRF